MSKRIGILFLHNRTDPVTQNNLASFRRWNPGVPIVTISSDEPLEGGFSIADSPEDLKTWRDHTAVEWRRARSSDLLVFLWYGCRTIACDWWLIVEWDAYCAMTVEEFLQPVEGFQVVGPSIRLFNREPEWGWFQTRKTLPADLQPYAMGVVPFCFLIVADHVLRQMHQRVPWNQLGDCNGEMRFATLAHACGYPPVAHPLGGANITWQPLPENLPMKRGMYHPVKHFHLPPETV